MRFDIVYICICVDVVYHNNTTSGVLRFLRANTFQICSSGKAVLYQLLEASKLSLDYEYTVMVPFEVRDDIPRLSADEGVAGGDEVSPNWATL